MRTPLNKALFYYVWLTPWYHSQWWPLSPEVRGARNTIMVFNFFKYSRGFIESDIIEMVKEIYGSSAQIYAIFDKTLSALPFASEIKLYNERSGLDFVCQQCSHYIVCNLNIYSIHISRSCNTFTLNTSCSSNSNS